MFITQYNEQKLLKKKNRYESIFFIQTVDLICNLDTLTT